MPNTQRLSQRIIFLFWVPLALTWFFMSAEQPAITAAVSRLPDAVSNLAAFGLTFSFALIIESPVIMLLTAATALATHQQSYRRLLTFAHIQAVVLTLLHLLLALTPLYSYILREWVQAPPEIIETSRVAFLLMAPWTPMIAYRRLMEGIMIRFGKPQRVTLVIVARLAATVLVLLVGLMLDRWPGAYVGAVSLTVGVTVGAIAAWLLARPTLATYFSEPRAGAEPLEWGRLVSFYVPLALTSLITMVGQPILAFGLAHAPRPLESLAIWPVVMSVIFIGRSVGIAYQEVVVALLHDGPSYSELRRFATMLTVGITALFAVLLLTPGATLWYRHISGLTPGLIELALLPTAILTLVPGLNTVSSWQRAILVHSKNTSPISTAVALNMAVLLAIMALGPRVAPTMPGAVLAASALTISMLVEVVFLWWQSRPTATTLAAAAEATVTA